MSRFFQRIAPLMTGALLLFSLKLSGQSLAPVTSGKGVDARTLVVFSDRHTPYSLADGVTALKLELRRVATQVDEVAAADADLNQVTNVDYLVIYCPQPFPAFSDAFLQAVAQRQRPMLWVGYGADLLQKIPPFEGRFQTVPYSSQESAPAISYQGRLWSETLTLWMPTKVATNESTSIIMSVPSSDTNAAPPTLAWKTGSATFFAGLPTFTDHCAVFSDLLLDYYEVTNPPPSTVAIYIQGYHCRQNHEEFRNLVKYLSEHNHPFMVGVIPAYYDAVKDRVLDLGSQPEFVAALRFAQEHGGRLVMEGYVHAYKGRTGYEPEFWELPADRAVPDDSAEFVRKRVTRGLQQMFAKGLLPVAWQTPHYAASHTDYTELAGMFSTAIERVQLSDATSKEKFAGTTVTVDDYGRVIVPENLGAMSPIRNPSPLLRMSARLGVISQLRGTTAVVAFPAYLTDNKLAQVVTLLEQSKAPFVDLADGDHWVQTADTLLLTGNARRSVNLSNARVHWQAFDRSGRQVAESYEPVNVTGATEFVRRGKGEYEIYQFNQVKP